MDALSYQWDFGDGTIVNSPFPTISHTYAWGDSFNVTLTVSDGQGGFDSTSTAATITEVDDIPSADGGAAGVTVTVDLREAGPDGLFETADDNVIGTFSGLTDSAGIYRSNWIRKFSPGMYRAEIVDLAHATFNWNQLVTSNDDDEDGDGLPDDFRTAPRNSVARLPRRTRIMRNCNCA